MEKVLVLGGAGFIGTRFCQKLKHAGCCVAILDSFVQYSNPLEVNYSIALEYRKPFLDGVAIFRGDATVYSDMRKCLDEFLPDRIVHLAAVTRADINDDNISNALRTSQLPIVHVVEYFRHCSQKLSRFMYVSSSYVYGNFMRDYAVESDSMAPTSTYGGVKSSCEMLVHSWGTRFDLPYTIVRPIAVYGPSDLNGKLSMQNIERVIKNKELVVMSSIDELSDYTYIDDLANGLVLALFGEKAIGSTYNLSSGKGLKLIEIVNCFNDLGYEVKPVFDTHMKSRPRRGYLDISKAADELGYFPSMDIREGLQKCIDYINSHKIRIRDTTDQS